MPFDFLTVYPDRRSHSTSSQHNTNGHPSQLLLGKGDTITLLEAEGPGCIRSFWLRCYSIYPHYLRTLVLKMYWDGEQTPSVQVPVGDFFGACHAKPVSYSALPMVITPGKVPTLHCYLPMPFAAGARIELTHEFGSDVWLRYGIRYDSGVTPGKDWGRLHACWRRENPTQGIVEPPDMADATFRSAGTNCSDEDNYLILAAQGQGHYIGCNLSIHTLRRGKGASNWYGEGDEMIFVDDDNTGERWPPTLHGTGTEDYFNTAWAPNQPFSSPWFGLTQTGGYDWSGHFGWYRWHLPDPVRFTRSIRVSIEHGHANRRSDDFASTAYWYQHEPHQAFTLPPYEARLPRADFPALEPPDSKEDAPS